LEYLSWKAKPGKKACVTKGIQNLENSFDLSRGRPRSNGFPGDAYFQMNPDFRKAVKLEDQIHNHESVVLASTRMTDFLKKLGLNNTEFLPVSIFNHKGKPAADDYFVIHPFEIVDCINKDESDVMWGSIDTDLIAGVYVLKFKEGAIPEDVLVFRPKHLEPQIFIREDIAEAIKKEGFTGPKFKPLESFTV